MSQRYLGGIITANPTAPTMSSASGVWTLEQQFQYSQSIQPEIIGKSVRIRGSAAAYLTRTPASSGNLKTYTYSVWVKRGTIASGTNQSLLAACTGSSSDAYIGFTNDVAYIGSYQGAGTDYGAKTAAVFRDPSAWYHIVFSVDTTQATAANRAIIYVNGVAQTTTTSSNGYWPQNYTTLFNTATAHRIGQRPNFNDNQFDGYIAEAYFIDGQALAPSSFGAFDSNGVWQPIVYTGTYGTNGFYIDFSDNSAATATTLGKDYSGNGNNWTPTNISVTAGTTYDSMLDSPTNFDNGGTGVGNYCTLNPLAVTPVAATFAEANLKVTTATTGGNAFGTIQIPTTGKWYWEITAGSGTSPYIGISAYLASQTYAWSNTNSVFYVGSNGNKSVDGTASAYGSTYTTNDVIGVAVDVDASTITFYKNNTSQGSISHTFVNVFPCLSDGASATSDIFYANFGQRPFTYTPPTGFKALNTQNLALAVPPTITNGAKYMAASLYTGNGGTAQSIANSANNTIGTTFLPDFVWIKARNSAAYNHRLYDSVRGVGKEIYSSSTAAEATVAQSLTSFNSNGFTIGTDLNNNNSGTTYVGWQWKASGTTSSITAGQYSTGPNVPSITSTVSIGATQGFSVVTYTGTGANATVGHGLGVAPSMIIIKNRSQVSAWIVGHQNMATSTPWAGFMVLNTTAAYTTASGSLIWNSTAPTSTVFSVGTDTSTNFSGNSLVAYCFAAVAGYSAFGSYTGNGSTDGPFVYTGFRPRFILIKRTDAIEDWIIYDSSRDTYNPEQLYLYPNSSAAEAGSGTARLDFVANGFKCRNSGQGNVSGGTYIYMTFAENPFTIARAR